MILRPFDRAQGRPFDRAQGRPFDRAQGRLGSGQVRPVACRTVLQRALDRLSELSMRALFGPDDPACPACGSRYEVLYLLPTPFGLAARCDACRAAWHQGIRDWYAHRAAEVAAAHYRATCVAATAPRREETPS